MTDRFLPNVSVEYLGYIVSDSNVTKAVRQQKAFSEVYPYANVTQCVKKLAQKMIAEKRYVVDEEQPSLFWRTAFTVQ